MDRGTAVKVFRKEVGIKCGTHENDLQVLSLNNQVFEHQQQEVTEKRKKNSHYKVCEYMYF